MPNIDSKKCDHGHGDAMRCTAPNSCLTHAHRCRECGMEVPASAMYANRFTPFRANPRKVNGKSKL